MSFKLIAATLLLALPVAGAEPVLPTLRVEPKAGGSIFFVRNVSSQPLTAYLIELVDYPGSYFAYWQDDIRSGALAAGQEKRIEVANMTVGAVPDYVKMQAAIYADGTTAGIPEKVEQLVARRRFMKETARDLIGRLKGVTSKESASMGLKDAAQSMTAPAKASKTSQVSINQTAGRALINEASEYLDQHSLEETVAKVQEWEKALAAKQ